eukprot:gene3439-13495_t
MLRHLSYSAESQLAASLAFLSLASAGVGIQDQLVAAGAIPLLLQLSICSKVVGSVTAERLHLVSDQLHHFLQARKAASSSELAQVPQVA